ncbi:hypothetical protein VTO73DRAFT_5681 [Trametes versicolor]
MANISPNATTLHSLPPEVLERICRELLALPLDPREHKHIGCRTVAFLARTSRLLQEPALNTLWHMIPGLAVLFFTLPRALYKRSKDKRSVRRFEDPGTVFSFKRVPKQAELERFLAYAQRVRAVDHEIHLSTCIRSYVAAPSAYDTLAKALKTRPLFPNIEAIRFISNDITPMGAFRAFHVLFGPKLRKLDIYSFEGPPRGLGPAGPPMAQADQEAFAAMVQRLRELSPRLQELALSLRPGGSTIASAVSAVVPDLKDLTCLRLADGTVPISSAAFAHLARLPNLKTLDFRTDDSPWADTPKLLSCSGNAEETLFPALRELHITAPTLALPIQLLRLVESPHIVSLYIDALKVVLRSQIRPLFTAIGSMPAREHIKELCVEVRVARSHTLAPLLALTRLIDLMLNIRCPFDVDDALLAAFATAWPHLDRLILGTTRSWGVFSTRDFPYGAGDVDDAPDATEEELAADVARGHSVADPVLQPMHEPRNGGPCREPRATLFGLRALAARAPYLDVLGLELDAMTAGVPPARLELPRERAPARRVLDTLAVGLSPIDDPFAVAAFLSHSFVEIANLESSWEEMEEDGEDDDDDDDDDGEDEFVEREGWSEARLFRRRWQAVERLLLMFEQIRRQERRWKRKAAGLEGEEDEEDEEADVLMEDDDEDGSWSDMSE